MDPALELPLIAALKRTKRLALDGSLNHVNILPSVLNAMLKGVWAMSAGFVMYSCR
jgi:hypothetical protein